MTLASHISVDFSVAALFVLEDGPYSRVPHVDCWGIHRDARRYPGPYPVVAHPPCERWGRMAGDRVGQDQGCFASALNSVRRWGGVLEHPADSKAWAAFGLRKPIKRGWIRADRCGGWTCRVEQGHYGHPARKATWLYAVGLPELPQLKWGSSGQRLPRSVAWLGYEKARRVGIVQNLSHRQRQVTPEPFRDLLLDMALSVSWELQEGDRGR